MSADGLGMHTQGCTAARNWWKVVDEDNFTKPPLKVKLYFPLMKESKLLLLDLFG